MAGLYIHIPFCKSRCVYCGFYSTTLASALADDYVSALCRELEIRKDYLCEQWRTIYIGGGTPSQLGNEQLARLFDHIDTSNAEEVTMECNPDDVTPEYADSISHLPVNRVSMGAQTFNDRRLKFLHRRHKAADVLSAIDNLRRVGVDNISIDLMYGFPDETLDDWRSDICTALSLGVEHISAYSLMYEEGTPLYNMLLSGKVKEVDEEVSRAMFYELSDRLKGAGYEHYEISNFAKQGYRSRHNSSYWRQVPYMGIGAAAHSFDGGSRQWNISDVNRYIASVNRGVIPCEREELDADTSYNDTVMLSLRTCEGIDLETLGKAYGNRRLRYCMEQAANYIANGLLVHAEGRLRLSRKGLFVSDMVMSDLMIV